MKKFDKSNGFVNVILLEAKREAFHFSVMVSHFIGCVSTLAIIIMAPKDILSY